MSRRSIRILAALSVAVLFANPALSADKDRPAHVYGPAPTWETYRAMAAAGLKERLIDPDSAKITWTGGFFKGFFRPLLSARIEGYVACGTVNARNRMGGYSGATSFVTVVDYDRVLYAEIDQAAGGMVAASCNKSARSGMLPPLPIDEAAPLQSAVSGGPVASPTITTGGTGLTVRAMPDGAYITAVAPASPAAAATLAPGMVIASINAIPLTGMGDAMAKIIDAAGPDATLTFIGGKTVKLGAKP